MSRVEGWIYRRLRHPEAGPLPLLTVPTAPYHDQRARAGGLRKPPAHFAEQPCYLENFIQSLFFSIDLKDRQGASLVAGGDGRYLNTSALETIVQMAAANGVGFLLASASGLEWKKAWPVAAAVVLLTASFRRCFGF